MPIKTIVGQILSEKSGLFTAEYLVKSKFEENTYFLKVMMFMKLILNKSTKNWMNHCLIIGDIMHSIFNIKSNVKILCEFSK